MKTTLVYSLAFALAATLATTGCKHTTVPITPMPAGPTGGRRRRRMTIQALSGQDTSDTQPRKIQM